MVYFSAVFFFLHSSGKVGGIYFPAVFFRFSQAAMEKFDEIKEQSSTGIQYAIEQHKYTDISVDLMSSYIIMPEGGVLKE